MLNIGTGELIVIAVVALLVLGPKRLPELARGIGKFLREFRRQTDEVRGVVEREFYKMDHEVNAPPPAPPLVPQPAPGLVPVDGPKPEDAAAPATPALALGQVPAALPLAVNENVSEQHVSEHHDGEEPPQPLTHPDGEEPPQALTHADGPAPLGAVPEPLGEKKAG